MKLSGPGVDGRNNLEFLSFVWFSFALGYFFLCVWRIKMAPICPNYAISQYFQ